MAIAGCNHVLLDLTCNLLSSHFAENNSIFQIQNIYLEAIRSIVHTSESMQFKNVFKKGVESSSDALDRLLCSILSYENIELMNHCSNSDHNTGINEIKPKSISAEGWDDDDLDDLDEIITGEESAHKPLTAVIKNELITLLETLDFDSQADERVGVLMVLKKVSVVVFSLYY